MQGRETVSELSPPREEEENSGNEGEFTEEAINEVDRSQGTSMRKKKALSYENKLLNILTEKKNRRRQIILATIIQENDR
jgi:hypothetical protein